MTTTALVAGPSGRVCDVAAALRAEGFATITVDDREPVGEACNRVSPRSVDCFVQLPAEAAREGKTSSSDVRPPRAHGLLSIVDSVAAVAPLLADHATVVILAEGSDPHRRDRLLDDAVGVLAEAVVADHGSDGVRVSVLGADQSPDDIAAAARGGARPRSGPSLADFEPDLAYADWRTQVLSLSSGNEATYFGWSGADGRRPVAIIRGAVVSPLRPVGPEGGSGILSWGDSGPGAFLLARALLADVLGSAADCPGCGDGVGEGDCPECDGTGLSEPVERQVTPFVHEIIAPLQGEGFELPAAAVRAWIDRRTGGPGRLGRPDGKVDQSGGVNHRRRRIRRRQRPNPDGVDGSPVPIHPSPVA